MAMSVPVSLSVSPKTVLIFGSQALSFDKEVCRKLKSSILADPQVSWIKTTITGLPEYFQKVAPALSHSDPFRSAELLHNLGRWLDCDGDPFSEFPLPNTILTTLTVISHLVQYSQLLSLSDSSQRSADVWPKLEGEIETLGLCTGLLSAAAISASWKQQHLQVYGAVAIRLAVLIGTVVDAHENQRQDSSGSECFCISWSSQKVQENVSRIIDADEKVVLALSTAATFY